MYASLKLTFSHRTCKKRIMVNKFLFFFIQIILVTREAHFSPALKCYQFLTSGPNCFFLSVTSLVSSFLPACSSSGL